MENLNPTWKMHWEYEETIELIEFLVKSSASAERESHFHELWTEIFNFLCKAFKKKQATISSIPQYDIVKDRFRGNTNGAFFSSFSFTCDD